jgi:hypothetical protein
MPVEALNQELRRALTLLATHNDGCPEAELLAEGFSVDQLSLLTLDGLTKIEMRPIHIGGQKKSVIWARITEAGRKRSGLEKSSAGRIRSPEAEW